MKKCTFSKIDKNKDNKSSSWENGRSLEKGRTAIAFSLKNEVGGLVKALKLFQVSLNILK
jgi:tryptophan 5-monooxygenase